MLSIKAVFDGRSLQFEENIRIDTPQNVIVLFLDMNENKKQQDINGKELAYLMNESTSFDFLKAEEEDIYSDADLKVKY